MKVRRKRNEKPIMKKLRIGRGRTKKMKKNIDGCNCKCYMIN